MAADDLAFGALRPGATAQKFRAVGHMLPANYLGRKVASLLLGPAGGRVRRAYDVDVFGTQKARLHPFDNICEKRVYLTPQHWDSEERALLAKRVIAHPHDDFFFADIGANVGLYTLFARAEAQKSRKSFRAFCVEPEPEMRARLAFNVAASDGRAEIEILPFAAAASDGPMPFAVNVQSRGMSRVAKSGETQVEGRTLAALLAHAPRIDAMKIDIEGQEFAALAAFFRSAPKARWPHFLIVETSHQAPNRSVKTLVLGEGYKTVLENGLNAVFALQDL